MFNTLSYRSWLEPLDVQRYILNPIVGLGLNICLAMLSPVEVG
jgi:hypothetical protein